MSNYVTVSTIGPKPLILDTATNPQRIVDIMISYWENRLEQVLPDKPDLIVLPEACDCPWLNYTDGFPTKQKLAYYHKRKNQMKDFFTQKARENNCYIVYSTVRETDDGFRRNSSLVIDRKGDIAGIYNKNHVVIEETIDDGIICGKDADIIECDFGRVACAICFDLNFDELRLKYVEAKPDILLFSSVYHGGLRQAYWAHSCRSHFVGAVTALPCEIRNPLGSVIASSTNYTDFATSRINLDCRLVHIDYNVVKLKELKQKYGDGVTIFDPGQIAALLVSSEDENISVDEMINEFKIEVLDDYMARALEHRHKPGNMEP